MMPATMMTAASSQAELFFTGKDEGQIERLRKLPPLERLGQPEDIANLVSFLAALTAAGLTVRSYVPMVALINTCLSVEAQQHQSRACW
jgi:NAD(P)-dependent dehydrogenase (short-subunit alcohol dehydrogenase family)